MALNDLGRVLFLQRKYDDAVKVLQSVLAIDPEDLQAHYNLMLCYNGLGNEKMAKEHQERYLRFKADESSQAITGPYRQAHRAGCAHEPPPRLVQCPRSPMRSRLF